MKVNVFNKTQKPVTEHVNGVEITVPPRGSLAVSEKKAREVLERRPESLSLTHLGDYGPDDFEAMRDLRKDDLQEACALLMRGQVVDFKKFRDIHGEPSEGRNSESLPGGSGKAE